MFDEHMFEEEDDMRITMIDSPAARRRRIVLLSAIAAIALAIVGPQAIASGEPGVSAVDSHTVSTGETLWSIAQALTPAGDDVYDTIVDIQHLNAMSGSELVAGEQILVPAAGA